MAREPAGGSHLGECLTPLSTTSAVEDGDGLRAIGDALADYRVVGLGEATHGTREFFDLKHRIVRHLVEEQGLRLFAIEAPFGEALAVDEYVRGGDGHVTDVVDMGFWTWNTESVRDLVDWLREFNDGRPPDDQVRFYGCDVQDVADSASALSEYVSTTDATPSEPVADDLAELADGLPHGDEDATSTAVEALESAESVLEDHLDDQRNEYVDATGDTGWRLARQHATVLAHAAEFWRAFYDSDDALPPAALQIRDRAMADQMARFLADEPHDRIALWAHNGHVKRGPQDWVDADVPAMGDHLSRQFGDDYYALAFDFHHGTFRARDESSDDRRRREFTVDCARDDALAADLAATDHDLGFLDVDAARDAGLDDWLAGGHPVRSIGGSYSLEEPDDFWETYDLTHDVDGILYVEETTSSVPPGRDD